MSDDDLNKILARLKTIEHTKAHPPAHWFDWLSKLFAVLVIPLGAWMVGLEIRTAALEHDMATHTGPPKWLKDDVQEMKASLKDIDGRLRDLERKR